MEVIGVAAPFSSFFFILDKPKIRSITQSLFRNKLSNRIIFVFCCFVYLLLFVLFQNVNNVGKTQDSKQHHATDFDIVKPRVNIDFFDSGTDFHSFVVMDKNCYEKWSVNKSVVLNLTCFMQFNNMNKKTLVKE